MFYIPDQDIVMERTSDTAAAATASTFLPPSFLPHQLSTTRTMWQDRLIMTLWTLAVVSYIVFLSPLLVVSIVFWIVAVEFGLESMTTSSFSGEFLDDDDNNADDDMDNHDGYKAAERDGKKHQSSTQKAENDNEDSASDDSAWYEWPLGPL